MDNPRPKSKFPSAGFIVTLLVAFVVVPYFFGWFLPWWPPPSIERRTQRQAAFERVQSTGGWMALQRDCDALVEHNRDGTFSWFRHDDTNALPSTIAALNPWEVRYYSPAALRGSSDETKVSVVHIKIFGLHATGGHSTPYFGLDVVSGTNADSYHPHPSSGGVSGNHYDTYRKVTDRIYEVY
jgi:hypothetical protein